MHFGKLKTNTLLHGLWIQLTYNDPDIGIFAWASYMQQCVKLNTVIVGYYCCLFCEKDTKFIPQSRSQVTYNCAFLSKLLNWNNVQWCKRAQSQMRFRNMHKT